MNINNTIIPEYLRNLITIDYCDLPTEFHHVLSALKQALEIIEPNVRINKKYSIFIGKSPFKITVPPDGGHIIYSPSEKENEYIAFVYDDNIFIDYSQLSIYPFQVQVALILEEFVHALMNVKHETLVKKIVCYLVYPNVGLVDGVYQYVSGQKNNAHDIQKATDKSPFHKEGMLKNDDSG